MVSISNVDLVMAALRSRLGRMEPDKRPGKTRANAARPATGQSARQRIEAIAAMRELPPDEFERTLVRVVLEMELGESVSGDPRFAQLIDRTCHILREDPELRTALQKIQQGQG